MRALGIDPVADTRDTFRALTAAMSQPGTIQSVPAEPADHAVLATLVDQEVTLATTATPLIEALRAAGRYEPAAPANADVVHLGATDEWPISTVSQGDPERPDRGATVVGRVAGLYTDAAADGSAARTDCVTVGLSGPGVPGRRTLVVDGLPPDRVRDIRERQADYPLGIDCLLTTAASVVALPRSVALEVV